MIINLIHFDEAVFKFKILLNSYVKAELKFKKNVESKIEYN